MRVSTYFIFLMASAGVAACEPTAGDGNVSNAVIETAPAAGAARANGGWSLTSSTDPLTDDTVATATSIHRSGPFTIEVAVSCGNQQRISYQFVAREEEGPAEYRWEVGRGGAFANQYLVYSLRINGGSIDAIQASDPKYTNLIILADEGLPVAYSKSLPLASSKSAVLRFPLRHGEATVNLDQSGAAVRSVIDPCLKRAADRLIPNDQPGEAIVTKNDSADLDLEGGDDVSYTACYGTWVAGGRQLTIGNAMRYRWLEKGEEFGAGEYQLSNREDVSFDIGDNGYALSCSGDTATLNGSVDGEQSTTVLQRQQAR